MTKEEMINFELPIPYSSSSELLENSDLDLIPDLLDFHLSRKTMKHYEAFNLLIRIEMLKRDFPEEKETINSLVEEYNKLVSWL